MAMVVNHNVPALGVYNALTATNNALEKSIKKLSTGLRINSAADDAAGLAISEKMRAQIRGLDQAVRNSQDGISMIQTAEGALSETHSILQRMRELSVQAANDTLTQQDRSYIQLEIDQLREEITRIGNTTQFNKKKLLDGSAAVLWSSSGINASGTDLGLTAIVNGGLRSVDKFGQKLSNEGNYQFTITAYSAGQGQVLKSDIFKVKHGSAITGLKLSVGAVATGQTKLRDIDKFWTSEGRLILEDPQTITITQGDGKQAKVTIYADDTLSSLATKLGQAIAGYSAATNPLNANSLNQNQTILGAFIGAAHFASYFSAGTGTFNNVPGTLLISTGIVGAAGELSFAGDEDLIKALSLAEVQSSKEATFNIVIDDAHKGTRVYSGRITGNKLIGGVNPNIDVEFNAMAAITVGDTGTIDAKFTWAPATSQIGYLHLADNTTVFQIGANEGEDMGINIGDMRSNALGLNKVLVTDRESAARSITIIDNAIDKVSMQRAKLGAYQNRLEHTMTNLTTASENLTAAESRIRDTDMASEMMNFTKLQILLQAGTSMLAQANMLPQTVLSLMG
jgi:flagellin-like hook-associated protein FlgL